MTNKSLTITLKVDAKTGEVTAVRNAFDTLDKKVDRTNRTLLDTKRILSTVTTALGANELIRTADAFSALDTRIKLVTHSLRERKAVEYELLQLSNEARVPLTHTAELYAKLARSTQNLHYSHKELLGVTRNIAEALTISGDNAQSAQAALTQLGQGLASGTLRGEELNSVMEQTPRLAQAIADGLGISIGELRTVAAEGKLTSKAVVEAIRSQSDVLNAEFAQIAPTVSQSTSVAKNAFLSVVGAIDKATAASGTLAQGIADAAKFAVDHTDALAQGFLGIKLVFQILKQDFFQIVVWIDNGIQSIGQGWNNLAAAMQNAWKAAVDAIGKMYYDVVNYILGLVSSTVNKISSMLGGAFEFVGAKNPFKPVELSIGEYVSSLEEAKAETFALAGTDWAKSKLNESAKSVYTTYEKLRKGVHVTLQADRKALDGFVKSTRPANTAAKKFRTTIDKSAASLKRHKRTLIDAKKAADKYAEGLKRARERLREARLYNAGGEEMVQMAKLGDELASLGKYLKQSELAEIYEAEIKKMNRATDSLADRLQRALHIKNDDLFSELYTSMLDGIKGLGAALRSSDAIGIADAFGEMRLKAMDLVIPGLGEAVQAVASLFGHTLSEAQIKAAAGRTEFESKGTQQIVETLKKYQDPQLTATRQMLTHLESMDRNLLSALASSSALDLSGSNFVPKSTSVLGGFLSASTTELIGSGIKFYDQAVKGFVQGVNADKYEAIKKTSSILGIFHTEKIKETTSKLPLKIAKQIGQAFQDGIDAASTALDTIGLNTEAIREKINEYIVSIGKVNLKDLSPEEQVRAINAALTEQLNAAVGGAIAAIASPETIAKLNSLQRAGEEYVQSLVRIATEHETVRRQLALFGQTVTDFATSDALVQAAGGLDRFKSAMDTFVKNFFSEGEQKEFLSQQLQYALQVHNVALPASKAQFRALVLETQQKIINVKATISALKAEIAAKVAAGEMSLAAAYGELEAKGKIAKAQSNVVKIQIKNNNLLIRSSHEASKAAVGFGKSVHSAVNAMITGVATAAVEGTEQSVEDAGGIDYDRITSPAIEAAKKELANLEGLYATLMNNMGDFAEYYGGVGESVSSASSAAQSASEKFTELEKSLIAVAQLKAEWSGDDISAKKIILEATKRVTGMYDLTYENFLSRFEEATANGLGMDKETLQAWQDMSAALRALHDAEKKRYDLEKEKVRKDIAFYQDIMRRIENAYTGQNSYLNSYEKSVYLEKYANRYKTKGDESNYLKALQEQLAYDKKTSTTREAYEKKFEKYIAELQKQRPKKTTDDVVDELQALREDLDEIKNAIETSAYQEAI